MTLFILSSKLCAIISNNTQGIPRNLAGGGRENILFCLVSTKVWQMVLEQLWTGGNGGSCSHAFPSPEVDLLNLPPKPIWPAEAPVDTLSRT